VEGDEWNARSGAWFYPVAVQLLLARCGNLVGLGVSVASRRLLWAFASWRPLYPPPGLIWCFIILKISFTILNQGFRIKNSQSTQQRLKMDFENFALWAQSSSVRGHKYFTLLTQTFRVLSEDHHVK
jgi:hypothetical protein